MINPNELQPGTILNNAELKEIFKCSPQGGMRRSHLTQTLVLVTNHVESLYEDKWVGDILHYTGMGRIGDQKLNTQNKTLAESNTNGVTVHLFEVFKDTEYWYQGIVKLIEEPYQNVQLDENGQNRSVWVFPVKLTDPKASINIDTILETNSKNQKKSKRASLAQLLAKAKAASRTEVGYRNTNTKYWIRSQDIVVLAKRLADGICQLCNEHAPFNDQFGEPYLETHHIKWLANGGSDTPENTVALCPNCHKKMHIVNSAVDVNYLVKKNLELHARLSN